MAEVRAIFPEKNMIQTSIGKAEYDYLVLAAGTTTNYFGNKHIEEGSHADEKRFRSDGIAKCSSGQSGTSADLFN